jgi:hypothetical protein
MRRETLGHLLPRRLDDVGRRHPLELRLHGRRLDARHVDDVLEEPRQPVQLRAHDLHLFLPLRRRQTRRLQISHRDGDRRERRLHVVAERRNERRFRLGAAPADLRLVPLPLEHQRLLGTTARQVRQVAADDAHGEQRDQRHDVLGAGDRKRSDRRQEEEVEDGEREQRHRHGDAPCRDRRDDQDDQQEREGGGGLVHLGRS